MPFHHRASLGFSLIELMIVIVIIGILTTMAIPSYQNYVQRARFAEVTTITHAYKTAISIALQQGEVRQSLHLGQHGVPPAPDKTKNLASLKIADGKITAVGTSLVKGATYILEPNADGTQWKISGTCLNYGYCND